MLNAKSSENFLSPDQNWANFGGFGGLGVEKVAIFTPKGTSLRESTSTLDNKNWVNFGPQTKEL